MGKADLPFLVHAFTKQFSIDGRLDWVINWLIDWMQASGSGQRCVFRELHSVDHYTQFQSIADQRWFVGFNRRGRRLTGASSTSTGRRRRRRRRLRCFQFVKTAVHAPDAVPGPPTIGYEQLYSVLHPNHVIPGNTTWRNLSTTSCTLFFSASVYS